MEETTRPNPDHEAAAVASRDISAEMIALYDEGERMIYRALMGPPHPDDDAGAALLKLAGDLEASTRAGMHTTSLSELAATIRRRAGVYGGPILRPHAEEA